MNTADAERSSLETAAGTAEEARTPSAPTKTAAAQTAAAQQARKPLAAKAGADWPLPAPISANSASTTTRSRSKARISSAGLSPRDEKTLIQLQARCEELGIKIKKNKLLGAGLQLLADAPTGKLLAILGPLECTSTVVKIKKKKAPPRV